MGATAWLAQQCEVGTRVPLLGKPGSGTLGGILVLDFQRTEIGYYRGMVKWIPSILSAGGRGV